MLRLCVDMDVVPDCFMTASHLLDCMLHVYVKLEVAIRVGRLGRAKIGMFFRA